jgi:hypothetical protein
MLVQPGQCLGGLEVLLCCLLLPRNLDQHGEGNVAGCVAAVEPQFPGADSAADQQPPVPGLGGADADPGPVVVPAALGALPCGAPLPRPPGQARGDHASLAGGGGCLRPVRAGHGQHITGPAALQRAGSLIHECGR